MIIIQQHLTAERPHFYASVIRLVPTVFLQFSTFTASVSKEVSLRV